METNQKETDRPDRGYAGCDLPACEDLTCKLLDAACAKHDAAYSAAWAAFNTALFALNAACAKRDAARHIPAEKS